MINARLISSVKPTIFSVQTGFLLGKFISENGFAACLVIEYARHHHLPSVGLLLDQEKAYDRVHPIYLHLILLPIGLPISLIISLCSLFFSTSISIIVNGFLSKPVY